MLFLKWKVWRIEVVIPLSLCCAFYIHWVSLLSVQSKSLAKKHKQNSLAEMVIKTNDFCNAPLTFLSFSLPWLDINYFQSLFHYDKLLVLMLRNKNLGLLLTKCNCNEVKLIAADIWVAWPKLSITVVKCNDLKLERFVFFTRKVLHSKNEVFSKAMLLLKMKFLFWMDCVIHFHPITLKKQLWLA